MPLWFGILSLVCTCGFGLLLNSTTMESLLDFVCGMAIGIIGTILVRQMTKDDRKMVLLKAGNIVSIMGVIAGAIMCVLWLVNNMI